MTFNPHHVNTCDRCKRPASDAVGLTVARLDRLTPDEWGFCSVSCMVIHVRERYIECARASATPDKAPGPPSGRVLSGIGGAQGGRPRGSDRVVQAPPTSKASA